MRNQKRLKCKECGKNISTFNKSGLCRHHYILKWSRVKYAKEKANNK